MTPTILQRIFSTSIPIEVEPALKELKLHTHAGNNFTASTSIRERHRNTANRLCHLLNLPLAFPGADPLGPTFPLHNLARKL